jgi:hypothetical protein
MVQYAVPAEGRRPYDFFMFLLRGNKDFLCPAHQTAAGREAFCFGF